jgi:hypothetical protein
MLWSVIKPTTHACYYIPFVPLQCPIKFPGYLMNLWETYVHFADLFSWFDLNFTSDRATFVCFARKHSCIFLRNFVHFSDLISLLALNFRFDLGICSPSTRGGKHTKTTRMQCCHENAILSSIISKFKIITIIFTLPCPCCRVFCIYVHLHVYEYIANFYGNA